MNDIEIIEKLKDDEQYYGEFGKQYLSNSDIGDLLKNPLLFKQNKEKTVPMLHGNYFHTAVLEPDKLDRFKIIESSTRNTKQYKELSGGEICMLEHEVYNLVLMKEKLMANDTVKALLRGVNVEYEKPSIKKLFGNLWKSKADIVNHDDQLVIDLKTTSDINGFRYSARKYNYDSQAYIYREQFGYDMVFIAIDKNTHMIGIYDCSEDFYERGRQKVIDATTNYNLFFKDENFDPKNYLVTETL